MMALTHQSALSLRRVPRAPRGRLVPPHLAEGAVLPPVVPRFSVLLFCESGIVRTLQKRLRDPDKQPTPQRARALVAAVTVLFVLRVLPRVLSPAGWPSAEGRAAAESKGNGTHGRRAGSLTSLPGVLHLLLEPRVPARLPQGLLHPPRPTAGS